MASDPEFQRASGRVVARGFAEELVEGFAEEDFRVGDGDDGSVDANLGELARGRVGGRACGVAASPAPDDARPRRLANTVFITDFSRLFAD